MKKLSFLFLFLSLTLFGQNPDGKSASLHLSPVWTWGSADYYRTTSSWFPPSQVSPEQLVFTNDQGQISNPIAFGFSTNIRIPAASFLTVSLSYSFQQRFEEFAKSETSSKYFSQYWTTNGAMHSAGFTVSVYNLFSIYQGD